MMDVGEALLGRSGRVRRRAEVWTGGDDGELNRGLKKTRRED